MFNLIRKKLKKIWKTKTIAMSIAIATENDLKGRFFELIADPKTWGFKPVNTALFVATSNRLLLVSCRSRMARTKSVKQ